MDYQTIGDICNYYGHLNVKQEASKVTKEEMEVAKTIKYLKEHLRIP